MKVLMFLFIFILFGAFFIISNNNLKLSEKHNINAFFDVYYSWLVDLASKTKSFTGNVVKLEWLPETNITANKTG